MERLYRYTLAPPTSLEQVDELIRLKEWFDGAILTTPTRGKMMKEYKERIRHACGHVTVRINSAMDTHSHGHAMYNGDGMVSAVNMSPPCGVFVQEALVFH